MTREQAKEILEHNWSCLVNVDYTEEECNEALNMAIEALSKRDNAEPIPQWRGCMDGCLPYFDGKEVEDEQIH